MTNNNITLSDKSYNSYILYAIQHCRPLQMKSICSPGMDIFSFTNALIVSSRFEAPKG